MSAKNLPRRKPGDDRMTGWGAVQYVGGGFSLVAFIVSAIFYAYRERLHTKAAVIKSAPTHDRLEAIATEAEFFRVNVSNLSTEQQSNIVLEQLRMSSRRTLFLFLSFVLIAIICGQSRSRRYFWTRP
jgi:hypothetical protein